MEEKRVEKERKDGRDGEYDDLFSGLHMKHR